MSGYSATACMEKWVHLQSAAILKNSTLILVGQKWIKMLKHACAVMLKDGENCGQRARFKIFSAVSAR